MDEPANLPDSQRQLIWAETLDGVWLCAVRRTGPVAGELTITRSGENTPRMRSATGLAYGAQFGPDHGDVQLWRDQCADWVDANG